MHGSTSPSKYRCPACSQRPFSATSAIARRADSDAGSSPRICSVCSVCIVAVHGWPGFVARVGRREAGAAGPQPVGVLEREQAGAPALVLHAARSAATSSGEASVRSRSTCQRMAGSPSSSQSITFTRRRLDLATDGRYQRPAGSLRTKRDHPFRPIASGTLSSHETFYWPHLSSEEPVRSERKRSAFGGGC